MSTSLARFMLSSCKRSHSVDLDASLSINSDLSSFNFSLRLDIASISLREASIASWATNFHCSNSLTSSLFIASHALSRSSSLWSMACNSADRDWNDSSSDALLLFNLALASCTALSFSWWSDNCRESSLFDPWLSSSWIRRADASSRDSFNLNSAAFSSSCWSTIRAISSLYAVLLDSNRAQTDAFSLSRTLMHSLHSASWEARVAHPSSSSRREVIWSVDSRMVRLAASISAASLSHLTLTVEFSSRDLERARTDDSTSWRSRLLSSVADSMIAVSRPISLQFSSFFSLDCANCTSISVTSKPSCSFFSESSRISSDSLSPSELGSTDLHSSLATIIDDNSAFSFSSSAMCAVISPFLVDKVISRASNADLVRSNACSSSRISPFLASWLFACSA